MIKRNQYVIQPYKVGPKERKSLVIGIPAPLAKEYDIDRNTVFILKPENKNRLILDKVLENTTRDMDENLISVDKSCGGSSQQISGQVQ